MQNKNKNNDFSLKEIISKLSLHVILFQLYVMNLLYLIKCLTLFEVFLDYINSKLLNYKKLLSFYSF